MDLKGTLLEMFVQHLLTPLVIAIAGVIAAAFGYLTIWLKKKGEAEGASMIESKGAAILARATEMMKNVVAHSEAELRPVIHKATEDGQLTPAEAAEIKAKALEIFKREFGQEGMAALKEVLGGSLDVFLSGLLERVLIGLKIEKAAATAAANP